MTKTVNPHLVQLARASYESYAADAKNQTWDGKPMPRWDDLPGAIQAHWYAATTRSLVDLPVLLRTLLPVGAHLPVMLAQSLPSILSPLEGTFVQALATGKLVPTYASLQGFLASHGHLLTRDATIEQLFKHAEVLGMTDVELLHVSAYLVMDDPEAAVADYLEGITRARTRRCDTIVSERTAPEYDDG